MSDSDKRPDPEPQPAPGASPREQAPVAEREPITISVLDTGVAGAPPRTGVAIPERLEQPRLPLTYWLLGLGALAFVLAASHALYMPLIVRIEHGFQRRVLGERIYEAPKSIPHTWRQKSAP